uniref:non-specific serine/threonine protein kinase n=1 Tax=Chromera velia CCMP2878 TaxID=1169474 RepID=A0A0G4HKV3_9ALVE|eukprot:Cvel_28573.t1-p1 / transcript=Cvel_28573.t1 / gene=Cvel_28573 / organism=Chromera_velia_CCMP2878 / gene_product=CDPK-related kinase 1, putative / transcript_product=CDPK-related kinase 1, putative / location=Cvel_scaffold3764:4174-9270(-) / protein_length=474 / sequence_SO=supercontig / SO=protein_coding / is_pseudo=false
MGCLASKNGKGSDVRDVYKMGGKIGEGAFGIIRSATHRVTGAQCACKIIYKHEEGVSVEELREEARIMMLLNHPNIVKIYEVFEDANFIYILMEKLDGDELLDMMESASDKVTEERCANYIGDVVKALLYLKSRNVCHRDIKPENFMFATKDPDSPLKILDFGLAAELKPGETFKTLSGTVHYLAPEVVRGEGDHRGDTWSLGVMLYLLTYGDLPFKGTDDRTIMKRIIREPISFPTMAAGKPISPERLDFLKQLLEKDPRKRITPEQALKHRFLVGSDDPETLQRRQSPMNPSVIAQARRKSEVVRKKADQDVAEEREQILNTEEKLYEQTKRRYSRFSLAASRRDRGEAESQFGRRSSYGSGGGANWTNLGSPSVAGASPSVASPSKILNVRKHRNSIHNSRFEALPAGAEDLAESPKSPPKSPPSFHLVPSASKEGGGLESSTLQDGMTPKSPDKKSKRVSILGGGEGRAN